MRQGSGAYGHLEQKAGVNVKLEEVASRPELPLAISMLMKLLDAKVPVYLMRWSPDKKWTTNLIKRLRPGTAVRGTLVYMDKVRRLSAPGGVVDEVQWAIPYYGPAGREMWQLFKKNGKWVFMAALDRDEVPEPQPEES